MVAIAVQAHRGSPDAARGVRENTLEAFLRARELGAAGVELDVRRTADGALAVHHDPVVSGVGPVHELAAGDLPSFVPLLGPALEVCEAMIVNIEIKNLPGEPGFDPDERVAAEVVELVVASGRTTSVVISSFWPATLESVREAHAELPTGLLVASWFDPARSVALATDRGCTALHPSVELVTPALVGEAHDAGLLVAAWTVDDRPSLEAMERADVDTVITDDVPLALATYGSG
jgi:glycerophosphoryl diester phosphodiesterase